MKLARLEGVFVANVTPFEKDGKLSLTRYKRHLEFLAGHGVHGFVPCGTTGEASTLRRAEWRELVEATVAFAKPRGLKTIAGCGGNSTSSVLRLIHEANGMGCDAALVVTPYYNKPTQTGLLAHYRYLADYGGLPIVLYNVPSRTSVALEVDTVRQLFEHKFIVGLKEATGSYSNWLALAHTLDLKRKSLLAGDDDAMPALQLMGGTGIISASANLCPFYFVSMYNLGKEGKWDEVFRIQKKIQPLLRALFLETNPAPVKYALGMIGHGVTRLRLPLVPVSPHTEKVIQAAMEAVKLRAELHQ